MSERISAVSGILRMILIIGVLLAATLGGLALYTVIAVGQIERAYPPAGRFVDVDGGRLHLLELGPADGTPVVLVHGASGNLGDMRLALGDRLAATYRVILVDRPGHGWSDRPDGVADADPALQAKLIHQALERIGIKRAIMVAHSWAGALATAYALDYPDSVAGLVLLAPATHPWPGGVAWYNNLVIMPVLGPLFTRTIELPLGKILINAGVTAVFDPTKPPPDYVARTGAEMVLRPAEFMANAEDIAKLKDHLQTQAMRYGEIKTPTIIFADRRDEIVSFKIHSQALADTLPHAKLIALDHAGHAVQFAASDRIVEAIAELAAGF